MYTNKCAVELESLCLLSGNPFCNGDLRGFDFAVDKIGESGVYFACERT